MCVVLDNFRFYLSFIQNTCRIDEFRRTHVFIQAKTRLFSDMQPVNIGKNYAKNKCYRESGNIQMAFYNMRQPMKYAY